MRLKLLLAKVVLLIWYFIAKIIFWKIKLIFGFKNWLWKLKLPNFCAPSIKMLYKESRNPLRMFIWKNYLISQKLFLGGSSWLLAGARSGQCNRSYCEAGIWGWHEDGSPPALEAAGALRAAAPSLGLIPNPSGGTGWSWRRCDCLRDPPFRPNSNSAEFRALVVLNHSCYVVLGLNWP